MPDTPTTSAAPSWGISAFCNVGAHPSCQLDDCACSCHSAPPAPAAATRAGVSVEASWHVECSLCGGMVTASKDHDTALSDAIEHTNEHRSKNAAARLFTGRNAYAEAEEWSRRDI